MKGRNWMLDEHQILLPSYPVPRTSVILLSVFAHLAALVFMLAFWHAEKARIIPEKFTVQNISGAASLAFNPTPQKPQRPDLSPLHAHRTARPARVPATGTSAGVAAAQVLREHAKQTTAAIMLSLKFRQTYGFSPTHDYQLAFRTAGEVPSIPASELPPRFEQYVVVEITIDADGRVAEDRIVAGMVDQAIQRALLSAIREFRYSPAKRDGIPVPCQLDIVIHIPTST